MKIILLILILFVTQLTVMGQCLDTIKLIPCEEMVRNKENNFFQFSIVYKEDTLIVPKVGKDIYINPVKLYGLDSLDFIKKRNDTIQNITLLFETNKFIYISEVYASFFTYSNRFCLLKGKKKTYWFNVGGAYISINQAKRIKKK